MSGFLPCIQQAAPFVSILKAEQFPGYPEGQQLGTWHAGNCHNYQEKGGKYKGWGKTVRNTNDSILE